MENNDISLIHDKVYQYLTEDIRDPKLTFTLRQRNKQKRLEHGFWFSGNYDYLVFSFWGGLDWRNKTPNIYFRIQTDGSCSLEFISYDDERKIAFFSAISEALGMQQHKRARSGEPYEHWGKHYKGTDYIASLDEFLKKDKKIIDAFIMANQLSDLFPSVDLIEFEQNKRKIDKIRKDKKTQKQFQEDFSKTKSIAIKSLELENISLFKSKQTILFHKNATCFIGLNGTGKTTILRALVLAFMGFEQDNMGKDDAALLVNKLVNLMRIEGESNGKPKYNDAGGFVQVNYSLETTSGTGDYYNKVFFKIEKGDLSIYDDSESEFKNIVGDKYKSLFLAFPQVQGESQPYQIDAKYPHIYDAISMLNNQPDNRFGSFADWLRWLNKKANDEKANGKTMPNEQVILNYVFELISDITDTSIRLHKIQIADDQNSVDPIWVKLGEDDQPILFDLVSQGFNNIFGWIGFFVKRLVETSDTPENFTKTPAIVLIDEIDTYLHPFWQTRILQVLVDKFPNVQFIVTTHSPYVVGSIPNDKISIYTCHKVGWEVELEAFSNFKPYGANIERLSEKVFGVKGRFVKPVAEHFDKLSKLIFDGDLENADKSIREDFGDIDPNDPELDRNRMLIKTKKILSKR